MTCRGNHNLIEVYRRGYADDIQDVVRWCTTCGAVVVDGELDGRTAPGRVMPMRLPADAQKVTK